MKKSLLQIAVFVSGAVVMIVEITAPKAWNIYFFLSSTFKFTLGIHLMSQYRTKSCQGGQRRF